MTSCQSIKTRTIEPTTKVACEAFKQISYDSNKDTNQTVVEIRQHNAAYRELCNELINYRK
jgi:subtilase family serine protease